MTTRIEATKKYAKACVRATKTQNAAILDAVVSITGCNETTPAKQLRRRAVQPPGRAAATVAVH